MKKIICSLLVLLLIPLVQAKIIYEYRTKEIPQLAYIKYPAEGIYWNVVDVSRFEYWAMVKQDRFGEYSGDGKIKLIGTVEGKRVEINYDFGDILQVNPHRDGQWFQFDTKINVNYDNQRTKYLTTVNIITIKYYNSCYHIISGKDSDEFNAIIFFTGC